MYFKTTNARITGKTQEPRLLRSPKYVLAYETVEEGVVGQINVDFAEFCRIKEGDLIRVEIASHDTTECFNTDSSLDVLLELTFGQFIHPDMR
ncbi:hypothetical protein HZA97_04750 [Candidatus Woesearchaeota archaeon]|nr:hypothetical protein [Candidatus Woesearchaeota archaeon]